MEMLFLVLPKKSLLSQRDFFHEKRAAADGGASHPIKKTPHTAENYARESRNFKESQEIFQYVDLLHRGTLILRFNSYFPRVAATPSLVTNHIILHKVLQERSVISNQ